MQQCKRTIRSGDAYNAPISALATQNIWRKPSPALSPTMSVYRETELEERE